MQLAKVMGVESLTFCDGNLIWKKGLLIISLSNQIWEMSWSCLLICMPTDLIWKPNHSEILGHQQKCYKQEAVLSERSAGCHLLFFTPVAWSLLHDSVFFIGRISWAYWNANSPFHIEPKYRSFCCMIDCIQGTSKATKKILFCSASDFLTLPGFDGSW